MPDPISCPVCHTTGAPAAAIATLVVCAACGASLLVDDTGVRRATAADTTALSPADLQTLRMARGKIARAGR
jgi:hypothetical protein